MTFPLLVFGALGTAVIAGVFGRFTKQWLLASVIASGFILYLHSALYFHYTSDDAYISYRYARNFADGLGLVWNPGEHVEGYTNFLWVVLLAGFDKAGADLVLTGRWLGFGIAIVASAATYQLTRDLAPVESGRVAGFAAAVLLAASGPWAVWASAGLEGPLMALLITVAVILQLRERPTASGSRWPPLSGIAWALVCMTRPDGLILAAIACLFKLLDAVIAVRAEQETPRRAFFVESMHILAWFGGLVLVYVPYFIWRYEVYGWLLPNTYYAKVGSGLRQWDRGLRYVVQFLQEYGGWALLAIPAAIAVASARRLPLLLVLTMILAWSVAIGYAGGDSLLRFRLFVPVLPLYYAAIVAAIATLIVSAPSQGVRLPTSVSWYLVGAVFIGGVWLTLEASLGGIGSAFLRGERDAVTDRVAMGQWMGENLDNDTWIAVVAAGAIPYESGLPAIDMLGLNDEHIAHTDHHLGRFAAGHEKFDSDYVLDRAPDIIILAGDLTEDPWGTADYYRAARSGLIPAVADMVTNPRLEVGYEPRAVEIGDDKWLNLYVRRDARSVLAKTEPAPE